MPDDYEFRSDDIDIAFDKTGGHCECCGKELVREHSRSNLGRGAWEAHHGGRYSPVILCTGKPENCHLNCGHDGDFRNPGTTPRAHAHTVAYSTKYSPDETLSKAEKHLLAFGYSVLVQGSTLQALHGRGWRGPSWFLPIGLVLFLVVSIVRVLSDVLLLGSPGLADVVLVLLSTSLSIYLWFRRERHRMVITVTGGQFTIQYDGSKAVRDAEELSNMLRE